jgi:hypothetical protein
MRVRLLRNCASTSGPSRVPMRYVASAMTSVG